MCSGTGMDLQLQLIGRHQVHGVKEQFSPETLMEPRMTPPEAQPRWLILESLLCG